MELRVLGALEVWHDGAACVLRAAKPRQLLSILATRPDAPVPADVLIEELWEGDAPKTAASALRVHVTQVRRALEPERRAGPSLRLPLSPSGYVLHVAPGELDSQCFESLVTAACEANASGDPAGAVARLVDALALWRGSPLADAHGLSAVAVERARLEELRIRAIEELADARLALGQHAASVELLLEAVDEFPLHEPFAGQLMLALYRSGRLADALNAYSNLARRLDQRLGIPPSDRLRRLEEDVLLQRPHLDFSSRGFDRPTPATSPLSRPRVVGRRAELGRLLEAGERAALGGRGFVLLSGPSGIGKTTLASEFCARVQGLGASVFAGACVADRVGGLEPIVEIVSAVSRDLTDERAAAIALLHPYGRAGEPHPDRLVSRDLESEQLRAFETIAAAIRDLGDQLVVLRVEDLHWASRTTLLVLRHLLRLSELDKLLVVATIRDEDLDAERAELIANLAPAARSELVPLAGLNTHEVRSLVRALAYSGDALVDLAPEIRDATDGNPFFVRAMVGDLSELPTADRHELQARVAAAAPSGVRALIERRIARVSRTARTVLETAAILGAEFSLEIVGEVSALSVEASLESIEELLRARLLAEDAASVDRFTFPHALVRNAVYAAIPDMVRTGVHRRAGDVLEARGAACAEIAFHYCQADDRSSTAKASEWAERAGSEASQRFAFAEAADWYEIAVRLREGVGTPTSGATYLALGLACDGARRGARARDAYLAAGARARDAGDAQLLSEVALSAAPAWSSGTEPQSDARRLIEDALDLLGGNDPQLRIQLLARLATLTHYTSAERQHDLVEEAYTLAADGVDQPCIAVALLARHLWLTHDPSACVERLDIARRAFEITREGANSIAQLRVERELLGDLLENGDVDAFDRELDDYEARAKHSASGRDMYWSMVLRATQATLRGDLSIAEQLARGALLRGRELDQEVAGAEMLQRFVLRYQQGRLWELVDGFRQVSQMQPAYRAGSALAAMACAETGQIAEGTRIAYWALGPEGTGLEKDVLWVGAHALLCGVAARAADADLARTLDDLIAPCSGHIVTFGVGGAVLGPALYWRGLLAATVGDLDRAVDHLEHAIESAERIRAPFWIAQAQFDLAAVHTRRGGRAGSSTAEHLRHRALDSARTHGFVRILGLADA